MDVCALNFCLSVPTPIKYSFIINYQSNINQHMEKYLVFILLITFTNSTCPIGCSECKSNG